MASTSSKNIDPIPGKLHRTLPISPTFLNIEPVLQDPNVYMNIILTTYRRWPDPSGAQNSKTHRKIPSHKITTLYDEYFRITLNIIHKQKQNFICTLPNDVTRDVVVPHHVMLPVMWWYHITTN